MATAKKQGAVKLTKMQSILKLTGQSVRDRRSGNLYERLKNSNEDKLRQLGRDLQEVEFKIIELVDLAPSSKDSLKVSKIDADSWNDELVALYDEVRQIEDTIELYERVKNDFFTPKTAAELAADEFLTGIEDTEEETAE